jgi:hypothetical protein
MQSLTSLVMQCAVAVCLGSCLHPPLQPNSTRIATMQVTRQILSFVRHVQPVVPNSMHSSHATALILRYCMSCCMAHNVCRACNLGGLAPFAAFYGHIRVCGVLLVVVLMSVVQSAVEVSCMVQADP